ncbi:hypothetical protein PV416_13165 [Streptomyces ipomoeae]|uniref:hypothetical protein n=1 Tax=Streptomyces ipomoeae TaxID=103232 RepID=UPI001F186305|nr:hypothetical protein [Streptomyces ipomoeae]MDX2822024.1 hypothetical protein [Streptomyces ipomoeae]MDX2841295.1 hypothetical protein [Streptomyces ipomoeae]MDX2876128.1 hypothetical protein [Streptomyces ipomoeae]
MRPLLKIRRVKNFEASRTGIQVVNAGLGPAIVTTTIVRLDGETVGEWDRKTYRRLMDGPPVWPKVSTLTEGVPVLTGQVLHLLFLDDFDSDEHAWFWTLVSERLSIEIFYESLYGGENFRAVLKPREDAQA